MGDNKGCNNSSMGSERSNEEEMPQDDRSDEEGNDEEDTSESKYEPDYKGFVFSQAGMGCTYKRKWAYWPAEYCFIVSLLLMCS